MDFVLEAFKKLLGIGMPCVFHSITGLYCPGCGGTRAVRCLLMGDIRMSFQYHPLVLYTAVILILELASWGAARFFHRPSLQIGHYHLFTLAGAFLVIGSWFYKNYMLIAKGVDLLPLMR